MAAAAPAPALVDPRARAGPAPPRLRPALRLLYACRAVGLPPATCPRESARSCNACASVQPPPTGRIALRARASPLLPATERIQDAPSACQRLAAGGPSALSGAPPPRFPVGTPAGRHPRRAASGQELDKECSSSRPELCRWRPAPRADPGPWTPRSAGHAEAKTTRTCPQSPPRSLRAPSVLAGSRSSRGRSREGTGQARNR
ncbi:hypothetical protein ES705_47314 [subsurface metagenome]